MKNHFILPYTGNKREEVETIYNEIIKNNSLENVDTIVEPYCGSSAMSYYISTLHPKKYKYILNDNDKLLIELYNIISNEDKLKEFINKINLLCFDKDKKFISKEQYNILLSLKNVEGYYIKNRFYNMRTGLYPLDKKIVPLDYNKIIKTPIISFLKNENVIFTNEDAIECILKNNNKKSLILIDPPYLGTCNSFYNNFNCNIYEWINNNPLLLINSAFILENNWVIKLLFKEVVNKKEYTKIYNSIRKKTVQHIIAFYNN